MILLDVNLPVRQDTDKASRFLLTIPNSLIRSQQVRLGDVVVKLVIGDYEFPVNNFVRRTGKFCFVITVPSYLIRNSVVCLGDVVRYIEIKRKT